MRTVATPPPPTVFTFEGFVTYTKWSPLGAAVERRLIEEPEGAAVLECGRVTGFAPGAFLALADLVRRSTGRVQLRNWPAAITRAVVPQLLVAQILDGLVSTVTTRAQQLGSDAAHVGLDDSMARLAAGHAELQQKWFGTPADRPDRSDS